MVGSSVSAREEILACVREALDDVPNAEQPDDVVVPRAYLDTEPGDILERFVERVADYGSLVRLVPEAEVSSAVADLARQFGVDAFAVPADLPPEWVPGGIDTITDADLSPRELDRVGAALTGCALGIAETGTVVLDAGPAQARRALTLVPDVHLCVIDAGQIVDGVPAAFRRLAPALRARRPLTFVSGPSATSDIELSRVEGVHGPRRFGLVVVRGETKGVAPTGAEPLGRTAPCPSG
jgi:L-lactate dehydrogenase complex protein LldG